MFGDKKKADEKKAGASGVEKPCCSSKKKERQPAAAAAAVAAAPSGRQQEAEAISSFMFGGALQEGEVPLVGLCKGDPAAIQACIWTPGPPVSGSSGKKGKKDKSGGGVQERFTIVF